jgi:hypothetical protein
MTDRYKGLIVSLDNDYRDDDSESIINGIKMIKGVADVKPIVVNIDDYLNRNRIRMELQEKLLSILSDRK